jgi:hypothetical protein
MELKIKHSLKEQEKNAELRAKYEIYNSLIKGGMYATQTEGKFKYEAESNKVSFDFVMVPFSSVKDVSLPCRSIPQGRLCQVHQQSL